MRLLKPANLLDVVHEVTAVYVFHHEVQAVLEEDSKWPISTGISRVPSGQQGIARRHDQTPESHQPPLAGSLFPVGGGGGGGEGEGCLCHCKHAGEHRWYKSILFSQ